MGAARDPVVAATGELPQAVAPPPGHPRFALFDSLRALAALSVLAVHAALFSGALQNAAYRDLVAHLDIGVTLFFLLSGFLLYRPFVAARVLGAPATRVRDYARRRFLRIAPAYWLALTALAIFPGIYGVFTDNWWVYYGLVQNYPVYTPQGECATDAFRCGISPTWSLAVEVAFYALLPLFALATGSLLARARRWLVPELAVLAAISAVSVLIQRSPAEGDAMRWLHASPLATGWWFALGMAMAALSVWVEQRGGQPRALRALAERPGSLWALALALYVGACLFALDPVPALVARAVAPDQFLAEYLLFGVICALILLPAVFSAERGLPRRFLAHPALAWLGLISYGIFLWHFPIMVALFDGGAISWWPSMAFPVLALTTLALTLVCAAASYYLLERPLMRLK